MAVLCSIMAYNIFSVTREGLKAKKNKATSGKKPVVKKSKKSKKSKTVFNVVATPTTIPAAATIAGPAAKTTVPVVYSSYTTKAVTEAALGAAAFATAQSAIKSSSLARSNIDDAFSKAMSALEMSGASGLQADAKTSVKSAKDLAQKALDDAQTASDTFYTAADNVNLAASQTYQAAAAAKNNGASDYTTAMSLYETASNNNTTLTQTEMEVGSNLEYARAKFDTVSQIFDQINQN